MSIRTAALVAFVGAVLGLLLPLWNVTQVVTGVVSSHPGWKWWVIPIAVLVGAPLAASMPVFYFALYRNREPLRFSRRFRLLSLAAALIVGIVTLVVLSTSVGVLGLGGNTSVLPEVRDGWNIGKTVALVGGISNLTYILLLLSIFQRCDLESSAIASTSDLFRFITKTAVMVGGTLLAISVLRLVFTPVVYFQVRDYVSRMGRRPPELSDMMEEPLRRSGVTGFGWHVRVGCVRKLTGEQRQNRAGIRQNLRLDGDSCVENRVAGRSFRVLVGGVVFRGRRREPLGVLGLAMRRRNSTALRRFSSASLRVSPWPSQCRWYGASVAVAQELL